VVVHCDPGSWNERGERREERGERREERGERAR